MWNSVGFDDEACAMIEIEVYTKGLRIYNNNNNTSIISYIDTLYSYTYYLLLYKGNKY